MVSHEHFVYGHCGNLARGCDSVLNDRCWADDRSGTDLPLMLTLVQDEVVDNEASTQLRRHCCYRQ